MATLTQASNQWMTRPSDERFVSLTDLYNHTNHMHHISRSAVVGTKTIQIEPSDNGGITIAAPNMPAHIPTHWAFSQLAQLGKAPADYLRKLPAPLAADNLNYGLQFMREVDDVGVLVRHNGTDEFAAATGPNYGRVWNGDIARMLRDRFEGSAWTVPGEFGRAVTVTKENTTLFASDRDMFVFLADEQSRIELPGRRGLQSGSFARGFFVWNSEVGKTSFGAAFFLFDYVCCNRIVWGAREYNEVRIRHTASAPLRWADEVAPVLNQYANGSAKPVLEAIEAARQDKLQTDLDTFLAKRFSKGLVAKMKDTHMAEEGRPIETRWDVVTAATAVARTIEHQDHRVKIETAAGDLLK